MGKISKMFNRTACYENCWGDGKYEPHWHEVDGPEIIRRLEGGALEAKSNALMLGETDEAQPEKP